MSTQIAPSAAGSSKGRRTDRELADWRRLLLPLMVRMIVALSIFFFAATLVQLAYLHWRIGQTSELTLAGQPLALENDKAAPIADKVAIARTNALIALEGYAMDRRYHQARILLMSRVWVRYLGFITGMILALVGAVFVLGRLPAPDTEAGGKVMNTEFSLKAASPGIVMAFLGVGLMVVTIVTHHQIEVVDKPVYVFGWSNVSPLNSEGRETPEEIPKLDLPHSAVK